MSKSFCVRVEAIVQIVSIGLASPSVVTDFLLRGKLPAQHSISNL
jgi:hypothetical protein